MKGKNILKKAVKKEKIFKFIKDNKIFVVLAGILLFGIFIGAIFSQSYDENMQSRLNILFLNSFELRLTQPIFNIFISSLASVFLFVIIDFFMGISLWGCILAPFIPFIRGFCIGVFQNYLYRVYGLSGLGFQVLIMIPGIFLSSIAVLLMTRETMRLSYNLSTFIFFKSNNIYYKKEDIRMYLLRTGCVLIICVLSAVADLIFNCAFLRFFSF